MVAALRRLPLEQQTLLELHYVQDMAIAELSEVFDAPPVTNARSSVRRSLAAVPDLALRRPALHPSEGLWTSAPVPDWQPRRPRLRHRPWRDPTARPKPVHRACSLQSLLPERIPG